MIVTLKRILEWILLFFAFLIISLLLYRMLFTFNDWLKPIEKYRDPLGKSIKVIEMNVTGTINNKEEIFQRLRIFYWVGE